MKALTTALLLLFLLTGCSPEAIRARQWKRYVKDLQKQPPIPPDTTTGKYAPNPELDILDQLMRKYPGVQKTRIVTKTEYKTLPGKTVYVEVPIRADTVRNRTERDSLLFQLEGLVQRERADSELRAEVAKLRANLLVAFNARACLPDTVVRFEKYDLTLTIKRGTNGRYGFTWREADRKVAFDTQVTENQNGRVVFAEPLPWWRNIWFYVAVALAVVSILLGWQLLTRPRL